MRQILLYVKTLAILQILASCGANKTPKYSVEERSQLKELVEEKQISMQARWANPMATASLNSIANSGLLPPGSTVNRIDLQGMRSFLEIKGDSVIADLPYYGERQIAGTYNNNDVGIKFRGVPEDYKAVFNEKKGAYEIQFSIDNKTENFDVNALLFPNKSFTIYINTSQRLTINYQGILNP